MFVDSRMIAGMRFVLAASALLIIYLDPSEPDRYVPITYGALVLYTLYSGVLYTLTLRNATASELIRPWAHWVDIGCYLALISLSSGTSSIFFFFFLFSILVASFTWGFRSGLRVTIVSSVLFTVIGYAASPDILQFELNRFLLRPIYLSVLGYMMAYWGEYEISHRRRLTLLKEVSSLSNPRFGVTRTMGVIIERLCAFYDADSCLLVMKDMDASEYRMHRADRLSPQSEMRSEAVSTEMLGLLLSLPEGYAVLYRTHIFNWLPSKPSYFAVELPGGRRTSQGKDVGERVASLLDAGALLSVPLYYRKEVIGRIFLISRLGHAFDQSDADFLLQVFEQVMPVLENIRLVDRLASDAAEFERQRIARDIHDSVIQPYIGLQIGLAAVSRKLASGSSDVGASIERLTEMTRIGIKDLRDCISGMRGPGEQESNLVSSVRRFVSKFSDATGIAARIEVESDIQISDRLAAEAFHMVSEGLSNIRRHTQAREAKITLACANGHLILRIENGADSSANTQQFTPRSITERAISLGGQSRVEQRNDGSSTVIVEIPL